MDTRSRIHSQPHIEAFGRPVVAEFQATALTRISPHSKLKYTVALSSASQGFVPRSRYVRSHIFELDRRSFLDCSPRSECAMLHCGPQLGELVDKIIVV